MGLLDSIILGTLQGLTEFLPVSSSGHLVIGKHFLGLSTPGAVVEIILHFGTFISIVVYYRKYLLNLIFSAFSKHSGDSRKIIGLIVLSNIPAAVIGILFSDFIETTFGNVTIVSINLLITGIILFSTKFIPSNRKHNNLNMFNAILIGLFQTLAILPGISRSGMTISAALHLKIKEQDAARFSFLMALPVLLGAGILKIPEAAAYTHDISAFTILAGFLTSAIIGYICLSILINLLGRKRLWMFSIYCWLIGILVLFGNI